jgi:hypothetical protein
MNKKSHVLIGTMFLLILFVFLGCPMDSNNLSKDKDQNVKPVLVTVEDGEVDFEAITKKLSKNQAVKLGNSSGKEIDITFPGTFAIPAGKELIIGDKVTFVLSDAAALITGTVTVEKGATLKFANNTSLTLLDAGMLKAAGRIEVAGRVTFEDSIKKHITLTDSGKVIAVPNSTVNVSVGKAHSPFVIGDQGPFTWGKNSTGGVELGNGNGFILTDGTKLGLRSAYQVASTDTITVADGAILTITAKGTLKGTDANTTLIVGAAGEVILDKGTANFYDNLGAKIDGDSISEGIYKWDPSINDQAGGWKQQATQ